MNCDVEVPFHGQEIMVLCLVRTMLAILSLSSIVALLLSATLSFAIHQSKRYCQSTIDDVKAMWL